MSRRGGERLPRARLARAGLMAGLAVQPAVWAAGRWGVLGSSGSWVRELDQRGLEWMAARRTHELDVFFGAVTHLGSFALTGPLTLLLAGALALRRETARAWFAVTGFGGAALLAQVGKALVGRPRPGGNPSVVAMPTDLSFPSAHATQATAFVLVVLVLARLADRRARVAAAAAGCGVIALVALSRVYLQVHHPSDVVAGTLGAAAWVLGLRLAFQSVRRA